jgi:hypothetical protein
MEKDCLGMTTDLIEQIREIVDQDATDPGDWY